ncbi:hypothetical protein AD933_03290 [Acetobacter malorum]|uniref:Uncharacterized protein n=1 Tax=Acetobacter malorum TaxID=178901 RepID=A0A149RVA1_9PROT|nr:hypothetical protein AD933_03290 [Acetobacter malorum]
MGLRHIPVLISGPLNDLLRAARKKARMRPMLLVFLLIIFSFWAFRIQRFQQQEWFSSRSFAVYWILRRGIIAKIFLSHGVTTLIVIMKQSGLWGRELKLCVQISEYWLIPYGG